MNRCSTRDVWCEIGNLICLRRLFCFENYFKRSDFFHKGTTCSELPSNIRILARPMFILGDPEVFVLGRLRDLQYMFAVTYGSPSRGFLGVQRGSPKYYGKFLVP